MKQKLFALTLITITIVFDTVEPQSVSRFGVSLASKIIEKIDQDRERSQIHQELLTYMDPQYKSIEGKLRSLGLDPKVYAKKHLEASWGEMVCQGREGDWFLTGNS